jgi:enoyl-CoA hydratase
LDAAMELAAELCAFPQLCMRGDRSSSLEQWDLSEQDALRNELKRGIETISSGETIAGAERFAKGGGRHGQFNERSVQ